MLGIPNKFLVLISQKMPENNWTLMVLLKFSGSNLNVIIKKMMIYTRTRSYQQNATPSTHALIPY